MESKALMKSKVLGVYLTTGDPYINAETIEILAEAGVDLFEFGIPIRTPKYDGLTIRASHRRALENGITPEKALSIIREFELGHKLLLTYFGLAMDFGLEDFMNHASNAGVEGILFPDLLIDYLEELHTYVKLCKKYGFDPVFFITSCFPHKLVSRLTQFNPSFIYLGLMASTGTPLPIAVTRNIRIMRRLIGNVPLFVGFAITKPSQILDYMKAGADGVIIGSAIIRLISDQSTGESLRKYILNLKRALNE